MVSIDADDNKKPPGKLDSAGERQSFPEVVPRVLQSSNDNNRERRRQTSFDPSSARRVRQPFFEPEDQDMMGPLLRRKKIVSVPLGSTGDGFFFGAPPPSSGTPTRASVPRGEAEKAGRTRKNSLIGNVIRRKQVSLDLYAPEQAEFFGAPLEEEPEVPTSVTRKQTGSSNNGTTF
jgi:hypothetical protein